MARTILFLSDYGRKDPYVGICHAVMARIAPEVRVVDLTHSILPQGIRGGAVTLADAARYGPEDAVYLAVVDPGVGTVRRPIAVAAGRGVLVGPDNGLLSLAWEVLGGPSGAWEIESPRVVLEPISETFHGRDVFAPAAAHVASGLAPDELGPAVDPGGLARIEPPVPKLEAGHLHCEVLGIDRFGNVQLSVRREHLERAGLLGSADLEVRWSGRVSKFPHVRTFREAGEGAYATLVDSSGWLAMVQNMGNAAESLGIQVGDPVVVALPGRDPD
ncbi:MAG: SAM hydrolase/SAM-dependent halogenase family protein [Actinomycetota bacterium]